MGMNPPETPGPLPQSAAPLAAATRGGRTPIAIVVVVVVVVVAVVGYGIAGFAYASNRIDSAKNVYNDVITRQNSLADTFNAFTTQVNAIKVDAASSTDIKQAQVAWDGLVARSQAAGPALTSDDASLAAAQKHLRDSEWLTFFSRSRLDQASIRIGHERKAIAAAITITSDFVQIGTFYHAFYDAEIDFDTLAAKAQAADIAASKAADARLKASLARALPLAGAPGLPGEVRAYIVDLQALAVDFGKFLDAAAAGDATRARSGLNLINADVKRLDAYDWTKIGNEVQSFYQPLIETFNSEVNKANNT